MKPLIVGNWKMNTNLADASILATLIRNQLHDVDGVEVVLCPPFVWLQEVASILEVSAPHIHLGAQDCSTENSGPYTGDVSASMLKDLCQFVIVGHSERREHFAETNDMVSDKVQRALHAGLTPIMCVGERQKHSGSITQVLRDLKESVEGVEPELYSKLVVAYEPVWSISTSESGKIATGEYANTVITEIKQKFGKELAVIYGGSVDASNVVQFMRQPSIDGVLVGAASLKASEFVSICKHARS